MTVRRLDPGQVAGFWRQLAHLLKGGLPLPDALVALGRDAGSGRLSELTQALAAAVKDGEPLSAALARFPGVFDAASRAAVRAGERSGDLQAAAAVVAAYGEKTELMRLRGRMVLTYPVILLIVSGGVCTGLVKFAVPALAEFYASLKQP